MCLDNDFFDYDTKWKSKNKQMEQHQTKKLLHGCGNHQHYKQLAY